MDGMPDWLTSIMGLGGQVTGTGGNPNPWGSIAPNASQPQGPVGDPGTTLGPGAPPPAGAPTDLSAQGPGANPMSPIQGLWNKFTQGGLVNKMLGGQQQPQAVPNPAGAPAGNGLTNQQMAGIGQIMKSLSPGGGTPQPQMQKPAPLQNILPPMPQMNLPNPLG
jgi:hypothetical protein